MIPITQTIVGEGGNCFTACLASILEISIDGLPNYIGENWWQEWNVWLKPMNLVIYNIGVQNLDNQPFIPEGYSILAVRSPRGKWLHAVVCLDGEIIWDPHPDNILEYEKKCEWSVLGVLDPSKPIKIKVKKLEIT